MRILITGATGFVGQYVVNEALNRGHEVIAVARNEARAKEMSWYSKVEFVSLDLNNDTIDIKQYGIPDALIHLAWSGLPNYKSLHHIEYNLSASIKFIRSLLEQGLKQILVTGTCFEFGMQNGGLSPKCHTSPDNSYGIAKDTLRKWLEKLHNEIEFSHQWVRLFYIYGQGQNSNSILSQLEKTLAKGEKIFNMSGGEQLRDYLHVSEAAANLIYNVENPLHNATLHCCSGQPISIRNLVENYLKDNNKSIELNLGYYPYPDYEPMAFWGTK